MNKSGESTINEFFSLLKNHSYENKNNYIKKFFENMSNAFIVKIDKLEENFKKGKRMNDSFINLIEEKLKELSQLLICKNIKINSLDEKKKQNQKKNFEKESMIKNNNKNCNNGKKNKSKSKRKNNKIIIKIPLQKELNLLEENQKIINNSKTKRIIKPNKEKINNQKKEKKNIKKEEINSLKNIKFENQTLLKKRNRSKNSLERINQIFIIKKITKEKIIKLQEVDSQFFNSLKEYISKFKELYSKNRMNINQIISDEQKKFFYDLIKKLSSYSYTNYFSKINVPEEEKLNLVLDLDHTLVYTNDFDDKLIKIFTKNKIYYMSIRKNLKYFFDNLKLFCNLYIYTTSLIGYGDVIKRELEKDFKVKFINFYQPQSKSLQTYDKSLSYLKLKKKNTLIFDDMSDIWKNEKDIVISSKKYLDINNLGERILINYNYKGINKNTQFVKNYYSSNEKDIIKLHSELNDIEDQGQLYYLVQRIQIIYFINKNFTNNCEQAFSILRNNILYKKSFNIKFCSHGLEQDLNNMIETCGGEVNNSKFANYFLISKNSVSEHYFELNKMKNKILDEKYIFDCFYNITEMDENKYKIII